MMTSVESTAPARVSGAGRRAAVKTLGCKINVYESNIISQQLSRDHWTMVDPSQEADLYVINSCTVTQEADRQTRQEIRRALRRNPSAKVVVTGCYAQLDPNELTEIDGVDLVVGNDAKFSIAEILRTSTVSDLQDQATEYSDNALGDWSCPPPELVTRYDGQTRAFVQVQQGCDHSCTFCVIHKARGPSRSFKASAVLRQAEQLISQGHREIVICGIDLGSFRISEAKDPTEVQGAGLVSLLKKIDNLSGEFRIRLSSIDPHHITDELLEQLSSGGKFCPYLHVSIQSASTLILKRMKRRYSRELLYERVTRAQERVPELVVGADLMVGFPTESDEQFRETLNAVKDLQIVYPHVFPFSLRDGAPASRIPAQVPRAVQRERASSIRAEGAKWRHRALRSWLGRSTEVLIERSSKSSVPGYNARLANYMPVKVNACAGDVGQFVKVKVVAVQADTLIAEVMFS